LVRGYAYAVITDHGRPPVDMDFSGGGQVADDSNRRSMSDKPGGAFDLDSPLQLNLDFGEGTKGVENVTIIAGWNRPRGPNVSERDPPVRDSAILIDLLDIDAAGSRERSSYVITAITRT
jgi:hypothetical protein